MLELKDYDVNEKGVMILWQIWHDRNEAVWNEKKPRAAFSISMAANVHREWMEAQGSNLVRFSSARNRRNCLGWHDLQSGWYMCGVDAAFFVSTNTTGIGIVLQNEKGNFVAAKVITIPGCLRVDEGEAMRLHEAFSWIKQRGMDYVNFRSHTKVVVDALRNQGTDRYEFGAIIKSCRLLVQSYSNFRAKFVRREVNVVAHMLAKLSKNFSSTYVWDEPPADVEVFSSPHAFVIMNNN